MIVLPTHLLVISTEPSDLASTRTQRGRARYSPLYERLVSQERHHLFKPVGTSSLTPVTAEAHKFVPSAKPLTSSHRKNDSRWSEVLSTSIIKGRQFVTGGVDVDGASESGSLRDPSTSPPALHNPPTFGNVVTPLTDHDQQGSSTGSSVLPTPNPEEFCHQTVSTSQHSSYSELAANLAYLSEANANRTRSVNGEFVGSAPPFHALYNSPDIGLALPSHFDTNHRTPPLAYDDTNARTRRPNPRKNSDSKARRHSSQTSGGKRAGRKRPRCESVPTKIDSVPVFILLPFPVYERVSKRTSILRNRILGSIGVVE